MSNFCGQIAKINDSFRQGDSKLGQYVVTSGIASLSANEQAQIARKVIEYSDFNENNDPYMEHDFGDFEHNSVKIFWKIDYYSLDMKQGSEDPGDPAVTRRVLTIMLADEY